MNTNIYSWERGNKGQRTLQGYVADSWRAYQTARTELKLVSCFAKRDKQAWGKAMSAYREAQRKWQLAESLALHQGIKLTLKG